MANVNHVAIRRAAAAARQQFPASGDPNFAALKRSKVGAPVLVHSPEGSPAFWMVPFLADDSARGFADVDLAGHVTRVGIFGANPRDHASWIPASFFEQPPARFLDEIRARYPGTTISIPILSYDSTPAKWAWRVESRRGERTEAIVYITPGGWYERKPGPARGDLEG